MPMSGQHTARLHHIVHVCPATSGTARAPQGKLKQDSFEMEALTTDQVPRQQAYGSGGFYTNEQHSQEA